MYYPSDTNRYTTKGPGYQQFLAQNIYPTQTSDSNLIFRLDKDEFEFNCLGSIYGADIGIRIGRSPLSPTDPSTYAPISKFTEYNLRKYHTTTASPSSNLLEKPPYKIPNELIGAHSDGKTDILMFGALINPLIGDHFKPVHLIPGCISEIIPILKDPNNGNSSNFNKLFTKSRQQKQSNLSMTNGLKQPKNNVIRNLSNFIERVANCDNYMRKLTNAATVMVAAHGRIINIIGLDPNPKNIEIDPPCLRLTMVSSVITCFKTFQSISPNGEVNLDILFGFATGDIFWLNPMKMKYSRWNKAGAIKSCPITSIEWTNSGENALVGFSDGEMMIFNRNFEDPEHVYKKSVHSKQRYMKIYKSLQCSTKPVACNIIAHYKFSKKPLTTITCHPVHNNIVVIGSDDGFIRLFDLLTEEISDIVPSYYAGILVSKFTSDGKYLLVGGEDDIVSIYEFQVSNIFSSSIENGLLKLVSRLIGAKSWIKDIQIDQPAINSSITYTIGTASDDGYIRFYEFQPRNLRKLKKSHHQPNYLGSPRHSMHRAFSSLSMDRSDSKKKKNTTTSIISMNSNNNANKYSLFELIKTGPSSASLQQLNLQGASMSKQVEGMESSQSLLNERENLKSELIKNNVLFNNKFVQPSNILLCEDRNGIPCIHQTTDIESISKILPVCEKNINLGRLSGLYMGKNHFWAFMSGGDLIRWKKQESSI